MGRRPKQTFFQRIPFRWLIGIGKDIRHCYLLEKYKSKLQWSITSHQSKWPSLKSLHIKNAGGTVEKKATLLYCWWESKLVQPLWRIIWRFLKKLKVELAYEPEIPLLCIHPETIILKDTYTSMVIVALFTIANRWKQPKCPRQMNGKIKYGIYAQWNIAHP